LGLVLVGTLVADKGDEETQFRDLNGYGLNVVDMQIKYY
jgi:hypothetical protein